MIAGLESATSGTIAIGGRVVNEVAPKDRDVAMVFQNYALYPHMTVAENLSFGLRLRDMPSDEIARRVDEAARMLGLDGLLGRLPRALSGGQRQRVALGRALVRQPQVFLLDEPLSNLDAKLRLATRVEIARLHRRLGATMIYVTHDQVEAMTLGGRIVVFNAGEIQQIDTPMQLYRKPANVFVAGFLGSPAMNFLRGTLERRDGLVLSGAGVELPLGDAPALEAALAPWLGKTLVAGLRPEDLRPVDGLAPPRTSLRGQVDVVEPVGSEVLVTMRERDTELVARLPPSTRVQPGDALALAYDPDAVHLFDAASEQRIEVAGPASV
jgi:multiple sugar transport system ATP-binding protein